MLYLVVAYLQLYPEFHLKYIFPAIILSCWFFFLSNFCALLLVWSLYQVFQPLYRTSRVAQKTIEINGVTIPEGVTVHLPIHLIHYNPEYWPEPEKFDPER